MTLNMSHMKTVRDAEGGINDNLAQVLSHPKTTLMQSKEDLQAHDALVSGDARVQVCGDVALPSGERLELSAIGAGASCFSDDVAERAQKKPFTSTAPPDISPPEKNVDGTTLRRRHKKDRFAKVVEVDDGVVVPASSRAHLSVQSCPDVETTFQAPENAWLSPRQEMELCQAAHDFTGSQCVYDELSRTCAAGPRRDIPQRSASHEAPATYEECALDVQEASYLRKPAQHARFYCCGGTTLDKRTGNIQCEAKNSKARLLEHCSDVGLAYAHKCANRPQTIDPHDGDDDCAKAYELLGATCTQGFTNVGLAARQLKRDFMLPAPTVRTGLVPLSAFQEDECPAAEDVQFVTSSAHPLGTPTLKSVEREDNLAKSRWPTALRRLSAKTCA